MELERRNWRGDGARRGNRRVDFGRARGCEQRVWGGDSLGGRVDLAGGREWSAGAKS